MISLRFKEKIDDGLPTSQAVRSDLTFVHGIDPVLSSKVDSQIDKCFEFGKLNENGPDTPYSTVVHRDLWTNNFMIRRGLCLTF